MLVGCLGAGADEADAGGRRSHGRDLWVGLYGVSDVQSSEGAQTVMETTVNFTCVQRKGRKS